MQQTSWQVCYRAALREGRSGAATGRKPEDLSTEELAECFYPESRVVQVVQDLTSRPS